MEDTSFQHSLFLSECCVVVVQLPPRDILHDRTEVLGPAHVVRSYMMAKDG